MPTAITDERVHKALTHMLTDHSEFGALALNLTYTADRTLPAAMATDGTTCFYNPTRLDARTDRNNQYTLAHETLHCALGHIFRAPLLYAEGFTHAEVNEAADYAVNCILLDRNGRSIVGDAPPGILHDPQYAGLSLEQIARKRRAQQQQQQQQQQPAPQPQQSDDDDDDDDEQEGQDDDTQDSDSSTSDTPGEDDSQDGSPQDDDSADGTDSADGATDNEGNEADDSAGEQPGEPQLSDVPGAGAHDLLPPPDALPDSQPADGSAQPAPLTQDDWQTATEQAFAVSKKAGVHSADLERAVNATRQVDPSCWDTLRQFVEATAPSDYSWHRPNRRFIAEGQYLPGIVKESTPPLVIAIDTSGSVTQPMLDEFAEHITALANEFQPRAIHVIYADDGVCATESFDADDEIILHAKGGGGTAFLPTFEHIARDADDTYADMAALIYITDLQAWDIARLTEPDYPVLWATPSYYRDPEPFGERVWLA